MGVATSSATFFRSMGGTFGTAVFLSILFNSVGDNIKSRFAEVQNGDPAGFAAAARQLTPAQAEKLQAGGAGNTEALNNTDFIHDLPRLLERVFLNGFADSMHWVFLIAALLVIPAFVLSFFVREIPLRATAGMAARVEDQAEADAARAKAETGVL
jgi:hypothetical protein